MKEKWLAVEGVCSEPVSTGNSLMNRESTGKFPVVQPYGHYSAAEIGFSDRPWV